MPDFARGASFAALFIAAAALADAAAAAPIDTDAKVDAVTVFPDAAIVTRVAEIDPPAGDSTLTFRGLPATLDPASFRVEATGMSGLSISGVQASIAPGDAKSTQDSIDAKLAALRVERDRVQTTIDALNAERGMILRFAQTGPDKLAPDGKPLEFAAWDNAWEAVRDGIAKVDGDLKPAQASAKALDDQIQALEAERQQDDGRAVTRIAAVSLNAAEAGHATFRLYYRVPGAGWQPAYDAALDASTDRGAIVLTRRALIAQRSGEDWRDVVLTVSTARVAQSTNVADLQSIRVDFFAPVETTAEAPRGAPADEARAKATPEPTPTPETTAAATETVAQARGSAYSAEFAAPGRVTILGDGSQRSIALDRATAKATLLLSAAPAYDPAAYLQAKFVNAGDAPILPGQVSLIRDGSFIGLGALGFVAPGDMIELGFGADDKVKVVRAPVNRKENEPTWFNQSKFETREYKTTVKNLHAFPVSVEVLDQLPISENTSILVELAPVTTPVADKQVGDKRGVLGWMVDLNPGESKDVRFAYRLKWPADRELAIDGAPLP